MLASKKKKTKQKKNDIYEMKCWWAHWELITIGLWSVKMVIKIYPMPENFHACNYCSRIFWEEVSDEIASTTEVSDDIVVGRGWYFSILVVERHLTEPNSCFFCSKGEMFDKSLPWNVEVTVDIGHCRFCTQKRIWSKTKFRIVLKFATMLIIETYR